MWQFYIFLIFINNTVESGYNGVAFNKIRLTNTDFWSQKKLFLFKKSKIEDKITKYSVKISYKILWLTQNI